MKSIEVTDREGITRTIFVRHIIELIKGAEVTVIVCTESRRTYVSMPHDQVKDMIAACYGAEDEED